MCNIVWVCGKKTREKTYINKNVTLIHWLIFDMYSNIVAIILTDEFVFQFCYSNDPKS